MYIQEIRQGKLRFKNDYYHPARCNIKSEKQQDCDRSIVLMFLVLQMFYKNSRKHSRNV